MSNLPDRWLETPLDNLLLSLESGSRPRGGVRGIMSGVPSIGGEHLTNDGGFDFTKIKYVPEDFAKRMTKGHIRKNDVLIVKDGATTGKVSFVDNKFPYKNAVVNEHVFICRPSYKINPNFLFHFLKSKEGHGRILNNFKGSAQGGINLSFAPNTKVILAPIKEQHRIVTKLEKLLAKVEKCKERLEKIPTILKRFHQSVLAAACSGELTTDWRAKNTDIKPASELLIKNRLERKKKYEEECLTVKTKDKRRPPSFRSNDQPINIKELNEIPATWRWERLVNITNIRGGVTKGRKFGNRKTVMMPYLRVANVQDGYLDLDEIKEIEALPKDLEKYRLENGDILYTEGGDRDKLGRGTVWKNNIKDCIHQNHIFRARLYCSNFYSEYISLATKSDYARTYFFENASQTVNLASINMTTLGNVPIAIPPEEEQREIVNRVEELLNIANQIENRYQKAKGHVDNLTQSILAKAFRGELVPHDPSDPPASELLKQIKAEKQQAELKAQKNPKRKATRKRKKKT